MLDLTLGITERLEKQRSKYSDIPEDRAWLKAYHDLTHEGRIIGLFTYGQASNRHRYRYIYAYCPDERRHLTYFKARVNDMPTVYISEYDYFLKRVTTVVRNDIRTLLFRDDMIASLKTTYKGVVVDFFSQFIERAHFAIEQKGWTESDPEYASLLNRMLTKIGDVLDAFNITDVTYEHERVQNGYRHLLLYEGNPVVDHLVET